MDEAPAGGAIDFEQAPVRVGAEGARVGSTAGTYIWLPTIPCAPGWDPVASVAALTRVTVGSAEWVFVNSTPSARRRQSVGVSAGTMASGRSPSTTNTITRRAVMSPRG